MNIHNEWKQPSPFKLHPYLDQNHMDMQFIRVYTVKRGKPIEAVDTVYASVPKIVSVFLGCNPNGTVYYRYQGAETIYKVRNRKGAHNGVHRTSHLDDFPKEIKMYKLLNEE